MILKALLVRSINPVLWRTVDDVFMEGVLDVSMGVGGSGEKLLHVRRVLGKQHRHGKPVLAHTQLKVKRSYNICFVWQWSM